MIGALDFPRIYQLAQESGGFFQARLKSISDYVSILSGSRIIDIGCGPGTLASHLPPGTSYVGFDIDERYIAYAKRHYGNRGTFHCRTFDDECARTFGPADVVMMNGVVHHIDDNYALELLGTIRRALKPGGILFTLDACFRDGQPLIARWLARHDRGKFVRTESEYRRLFQAEFDNVSTHVREDLSWIPYTFLVGISRKQSIVSTT